jgi:hypothetical protein
VQVNLSKKLKPALKDQIDIVVEFAIEGYLLLNDPCVVQDAGNLNLALVDLSVNCVPVKVVQFVEVKRVVLVGHYIKQKGLISAFIGIYIACWLTFYKVLHKTNFAACNKTLILCV